jgi:hypothetical protein
LPWVGAARFLGAAPTQRHGLATAELEAALSLADYVAFGARPSFQVECEVRFVAAYEDSVSRSQAPKGALE